MTQKQLKKLVKEYDLLLEKESRTYRPDWATYFETLDIEGRIKRFSESSKVERTADEAFALAYLLLFDTVWYRSQKNVLLV